MKKYESTNAQRPVARFFAVTKGLGTRKAGAVS
jgi:hypothetical protein